ncbi:MAG: hypothetical protein ABR875_01115 [Minisyncoccia bacterium]|jgi:hypothetical protein
MSLLPKEAIEEFKNLYQKRFKIQLTDAEASFRANNLVNLYKIVYGEQEAGPIKNALEPSTERQEKPSE